MRELWTAMAVVRCCHATSRLMYGTRFDVGGRRTQALKGSGCPSSVWIGGGRGSEEDSWEKEKIGEQRFVACMVAFCVCDALLVGWSDWETACK